MTFMGWVRSTDFVGRWTEQRLLAEFLEHVDANHGGVLLLAGEPGIGKSRLAEEAANNASRVGFTVAWGRCRESDGAPPLWPWTQVLRQLRISSLTPAGEADPASRCRFVDTVTERLAQLCRLTPLLIVLDDVHRADDVSMRLLGFVADQIWPARIGFIVTYRANEVADGPRGSVITGLAAHRRTLSMILQGLGVDEVGQWLRHEHFDAADLNTAELHARTGGNPLFMSEMARLMQVGHGDRIPPSARELM